MAMLITAFASIYNILAPSTTRSFDYACSIEITQAASTKVRDTSASSTAAFDEHIEILHKPCVLQFRCGGNALLTTAVLIR